MVRVAAGIKEEFHLSNLSLHHPHPYRFVTGQCQSRALYGCWRVFWAAYHVTWVLLSWVLEPWAAYCWGERLKWFIYLTNWTYLLLTVETVLEAVNFVYVHVCRTDIVHGKHGVSMPWYLKLQWFLYNMVTTGSLMVTVWYWTLLYTEGKQLGAVRVVFHALQSLYVLLNLLLTAGPSRLLHALHPLLLALTYTLFTALYQLSGGRGPRGERAIYRLTDWAQRPERALLASSLSNFLAVPLMHLTLCLLRWGVERGWRCWRGRRGAGGEGGGGVGRRGAGGAVVVACIDLEGNGESSSVQGEPLMEAGE